MLTLDPAALASRLLGWYDHNRRHLPWRAAPGVRPDPYHVWLSEIMLQQTTVVVVAPYFRNFLDRWPTVHDLAAAPLDDILQAWAGLGYYARARNLHQCAQTIVAWRDGVFPQDEESLRKLPGIGDYTAAAIAAIAFDHPATVVDGNVERVISRLFALTTPLPTVKGAIKKRAALLTPQERPGDYAQAMMDLGATLCTPRSPACGLCPWMDVCEARHLGIAETLPARAEKPERPTRYGVAFWGVRKDGAVFLRRRPASGLLGGMTEIPSTPWQAEAWEEEGAIGEAPFKASWRPVPGVVRHTFSHFHLSLTLMTARIGRNDLARGFWCPLDDLDKQALPSIMRKVVRHALSKAY